jgi:hypothetical protein
MIIPAIQHITRQHWNSGSFGISRIEGIRELQKAVSTRRSGIE